VVLVERNRFGGSAELDRVQLNLEYLASGSIQQEVSVAERRRACPLPHPNPNASPNPSPHPHPTPAPNQVTFAERDGRNVLETYRCQFHIYFQEIFTYQIKFVDWQGENLQAASRTEPLALTLTH
jgi:hypothetical protein